MSDQGPDIKGPGGPDETDADLTAAEHVLGLTDGDARVAAADRARADPDFAARLDAWERRLSPLIGDVAPINPPDAVWTRIAGSIAAESLNSSPATSTVFAFPDRGRWLDNLTVWRAATGLSALAAACLAIVLMLPSRPAAPAAQQIATLAAPNGKALYVATLDVRRDTVTVVPVGGLAAPGRSPELWIIPAGGKPRPVGLLPAASARLPASAAVISDAKAKAILAVSLEPHGGSPTGAPTGPVIASGPLQAL